MEIKEGLYHAFPDAEKLKDWYRGLPGQSVPKINGHIHTPYSFSAFTDIRQAFSQADQEGVAVLGINDFYTTDGYGEFAGLALEHRIFPLFNIEFMALQRDLQESGIRVNDPNNPGRTYFSGKGLKFPVEMSDTSAEIIKNLQAESNRQTYEMVDKVNEYFHKKGIDIHFNAGEVQRRLSRNLFRERHIAQAIRIAVFEKESTDSGRARLLEKIFDGRQVKSPVRDTAALENEIRGNLLKSGGAAFVSENPEAFLSLEEVIHLITDAGGIPCYPVLLDNPAGGFTDYEGNREKLLGELLQKGVYCIELIPGRNDFTILKDFVTFFREKGFVIMFGTEHNTPSPDPLEISCRGGVPLDDELKTVNHEGAAVVAAHQYLISRGEEGYLKGQKAKVEEKDTFVELGKAVIARFCQA